MADTHASSEELVYFDGKPVPVHESHHHILPLKMYFGVFGALIVLTVITVLISFANLGAASLPVAMFVALIKAGLVVGYFMHLKYDDRFNAFIFAATLLFIATFFILTFVDIASRDAMQEDWGNFNRVEHRIDASPDYSKWRDNFRTMESSH